MKEIDLIIRNSKYYVICRKRKTFFLQWKSEEGFERVYCLMIPRMIQWAKAEE